MRNNFWKLDPQYTPVEQPDVFSAMLETSRHVCNVEYLPDKLEPASPHPKKTIANTKFENVSFSKTKILKIHFVNCEFVDCLFVGTIFKECSFTDCIFKSVNMSYCRFKSTYIQPDCLRSVFYEHPYSNLAIKFYQSLYDNFKNSSQPELLRGSEYYFMKWNLIHTKENLKRCFIGNRKNKFRSVKNLLPRLASLLIQQLFGFGIKLKCFLPTLFLMFLLWCAVNYIYWVEYCIVPASDGTIRNVVFYTFYSFASYGSTPMSPTSPLGISLAIVQGVFGWIFLGVGLSMIIKKFVR